MRNRYKFNSRSEDGQSGTDGLEVVAETEDEAREILLQDEATAEFEPNLTLISISHDI